MKKILFPLIFVVSIAAFLSASTGCYCWETAHQAEPKCVVARTVVDCGKGEIQQYLPRLLPLVSWILSGVPDNGTPDWNTMLNSLIATGFDFVGCTAEQLENALQVKVAKMQSMADSNMLASSTPDFRFKFEQAKLKASTAHNRWAEFKAKNFSNLKFKVPEKNILVELVQ